MTEGNNEFGQFGWRSAKFDELLKKYQTIGEGDTIDAPAHACQPEPEAVSQAEEEPVQVEQAPEQEPAAEVIHEPQPVESPQPEVQDFNFDESVATQETEQNFSDETDNEEYEFISEAETESESETEEIEPEYISGLTEESEYIPELIEEPEDIPEPESEIEPEQEEEQGFSYDIDMFSSGSVSKAPDIDGFDDSWIDSALDNSFFFRSGTEEEAGQEIAAEQEEEPVKEPWFEQYVEPVATDDFSAQTESVPVTEYEQESYTADPMQYNPKVFSSPEQSEPVKDAMAGGYIAASDFDDFEFDPGSGMGFEENENSAQSSLAKSAKQKKKSAREKKKESGKNEMSSVTGFSKNYKASEGKGSKKDGFLVRNFIPKSSDTALEKARKIIMIICVLTFVVAAVYLFGDFVVQPAMTANRLEKLEGMVGNSSDVADKNELAEDFPGVDFPDGMLEKYAGLYAENEDLAGWIKIDGIDVSLPVVKGKDNDKYLNHDFDGNYNKYGSIFMNCENDSKNLNFNTVLFGHHMIDSSMFGDLDYYKDVENYKKTPVIEFNTIYGEYKWKIFAVFVTNGTAEGDDGYIFDYTFTDLSSPEEVEKFLGEVNQRAIYKPEVDISVSDKILTLSTCSYEFDEARFVVMARMVRPGESEEVSGKVVINDNPRYPAAYYEKKGLTNPYESAYKWRPS